MPSAKKPAKSMTTAQQLGSIVKSARQIMRKDKGLSGELDRLPILTWVMFLKFLDDLEQLRETEAALQGKPFQPAIAPPYRWRDRAAVEGGITGDELIAFINQERAVLPDGRQGPGLFGYLRNQCRTVEDRETLQRASLYVSRAGRRYRGAGDGFLALRDLSRVQYPVVTAS